MTSITQEIKSAHCPHWFFIRSKWGSTVKHWLVDESGERLRDLVDISPRRVLALWPVNRRAAAGAFTQSVHIHFVSLPTVTSMKDVSKRGLNQTAEWATLQKYFQSAQFGNVVIPHKVLPKKNHYSKQQVAFSWLWNAFEVRSVFKSMELIKTVTAKS